MATNFRVLASLRQLAAAIFTKDVALRRDRGELHVVLAERPPPGQPRAPSREEAAKRKRQTELTQIRVELAALLNERPETRTTMRHLVCIEQVLAKRGLKVLHKLPLDVLQRAHEQFENLVTNWEPQGLANLRSKMAVAIIDREHMDPEAEADAYRTAAVMEVVRADPAAAAAPAADDDAALAAAYAALGDFAPSEFQMQGELGSASARELLKPDSRPHEPTAEISIRVLQP